MVINWRGAHASFSAVPQESRNQFVICAVSGLIVPNCSNCCKQCLTTSQILQILFAEFLARARASFSALGGIINTNGSNNTMNAIKLHLRTQC